MNGGQNDHLETELKFDAGPGFVVPDLSALAGGLTVTEPETTLLVATYFDTGDLRLDEARVTLGRRPGGADQGWHLKLPVAQGSDQGPAERTRQELHEPLGGSDAVPARFQAETSRWTQGRPLGVVAVLETRRSVRRLVAADGKVAAELADDLVTGRVTGPADATPEPVRWREIEVELADGGPEILAAAASALEAAGAQRSSSASKLARLLGSPAARKARQQRPAHS
jgi:inorganic triphosphatase YgiF